MTDIVQQARQALGGITPGTRRADDLDVYALTRDGSGHRIHTIGAFKTPADAEFDAAAPELVRRLAAEVEQLRAAWRARESDLADSRATSERRRIQLQAIGHLADAAAVDAGNRTDSALATEICAVLDEDWEPTRRPYVYFGFSDTDGPQGRRHGVWIEGKAPKYRCTVIDDTWSTAIVYYDWLRTDVSMDNPTELARLALNQFAEYVKKNPENFGRPSEPETLF